MLFPPEFSSRGIPAFSPSAGGLGRLPQPGPPRRRYGLPAPYPGPGLGYSRRPASAPPPPPSFPFGRVPPRSSFPSILSDPDPGPEFGIFPSVDRFGNVTYW